LQEITLQSNPKLRVLVVSYAYYPVVGGLSQQAHLLNRALQAHGVDVTVLTIRIKGYPKIDSLDNIQIFRLWTLIGKERGYRARVYPWLLPLALYLIAHRREYDVIHIHQALHPAAVCVVLGKLLGKPTVIRVTGSGTSGNITTLKTWWWLGFLVRLVMPHTNCFISLSEDITSELKAEGIPEEKIVNIHNGVDTTSYLPRSPQLDVLPGRMVLGVGRLSEEKGFDILVRAWAKVINQEPDAQLVIVGDGQDMQILKDMAQQLGIEKRVSFEGYQNNVSEYLNRTYIFVLPSRNEGMSNALLEAMASGRACIASDIPANLAVLTSGVDGLLFKKNDPDDLAAQILQLLRGADLGRELGVNARDTIIARFSIDAVARKYVELYLQLVTIGHPKV